MISSVVSEKSTPLEKTYGFEPLFDASEVRYWGHTQQRNARLWVPGRGVALKKRALATFIFILYNGKAVSNIYFHTL